MTYSIEKGIPVPPIVAPSEPKPDSLLGTLRRMEVGDSVLLEKRTSVGSMSKLPGKRFTSRTVDGGTRVWRVQ